jgi:hypothetical protein
MAVPRFARNSLAVSMPLLLSSAFASSILPLAGLGAQNLASFAQDLDCEDA